CHKGSGRMKRCISGRPLVAEYRAVQMERGHSSAYNDRRYVVYRKRRWLWNKKIGEKSVCGNYSPIEGFYHYRNPPTDAQVETALLRFIADYEFPRPDIEVCEPCKRL